MLSAFLAESAGRQDVPAFLAECNRALSDMAREETDRDLAQVLFEASMGMKNGFSRSDA